MRDDPENVPVVAMAVTPIKRLALKSQPIATPQRSTVRRKHQAHRSASVLTPRPPQTAGWGDRRGSVLTPPHRPP